ncbi:MAG: TonB-dependent receptor plug domain-containing protein, partial [Candidatus Latescibacteria bacterium]|nr:TonB-dependent receptor plug domain-containing protein [Candidatus Latescibacterota bacterium]
LYTYVGYTTHQETQTIEVSEEKRVDVALTIMPTATEEMVVEADRYEEERTIQTGFISVETQKLREFPAIGETDILRSLQLLPGIQSVSDISSGLYIRGGGPDQTLILLDQIPLYNPSHAFGFFSTFNADAIKDMSLHKGAYPAQYGGRLGSVLDVSNRDGNRNAFHTTGGISLISGRLMVEGPVKQGSWMASGRRTYLDPILAAIRARGTDVPAYYFYDLNAKINQDVGDGDTFVASGYFGRDNLDYDLDEGSFVKIRWGNTALTGKWTHVFSPSMFGNFMFAHSEYTSTTSLSFFETPISFSNSIRDVSLKGDLDYAANSRHALSAGFLTTLYRFSFNQVFNQQEQLDLRLRPTLISLYLQDQWQFLIDTTLRLGGRSTYFSEGKRWDIEPRLSISHVLTPEVLVKFGAGVYHQYLQLVTTEGFSGGDFWVPLDETVRPGRAWQTVGALEWEPSQRYHVSVEGYYTELRDLAIIDNKVAADTGDEASHSEDVFVSGGRGYATGMELFLQRRTDALTGWIGYTLGRTRRRFAELNQGRFFPPKYDRRHDLSVVANYRRGRWSFGANLIYGTGQAFTPVAARYTLRSPATGLPPDEDFVLPARRNSARLLPYHRLDLNINRGFHLLGKEAEWFIQVFNVYNRRNEWFIQYKTEKPETDPEVVKMLPIIPTVGVDFRF